MHSSIRHTNHMYHVGLCQGEQCAAVSRGTFSECALDILPHRQVGNRLQGHGHPSNVRMSERHLQRLVVMYRLYRAVQMLVQKQFCDASDYYTYRYTIGELVQVDFVIRLWRWLAVRLDLKEVVHRWIGICYRRLVSYSYAS